MLSMLVSLVATAATFQPVVTQRLTAPGTQQLRQELGVLSAPLVGELSSAARDWALGQRDHLGLSPAATLRSTESFSTRFGASFHLQVQVGGVDVYGQKLVVTIDELQRVVQVTSSVEHFAGLDVRWALDPTEALVRAARAVPLPVLRSDGSKASLGATQRLLFDVGDALHAGYLAYVPSLDATKNWYVAIDAVTGDTLFAQNRVFNLTNLSANVYPVSPGGLDAGVGTTATVIGELSHRDGGSMVLPTDGGVLEGTQLVAWNCCPTKDCNPDAGQRRSTGTTTFQSFTLAYDVPVCDRLHRASNDPTRHASGNFAYAPVDPPTNTGAVLTSDPANSDEFAEVHAFYHVNRVYDWVRGLSAAAQQLPGQSAISPFKMRDERRSPPQKPAVWANVMFPNFTELRGKFPCGMGGGAPCKTDTLIRVDNAAFMPVEQLGQVPLPEFNLGVDTLMIFQGNSADPAYDATVLEHEFGHGVVHSTAALAMDSLAMDTRAANNEGGALHEGFADYIAGAYNDLAENGPYFGPRVMAGLNLPGVKQESYLRTMDNSFSCPDVLWGEVHQDSQHVSAALWKARNGPFKGSNQGATFDAAFYAMLVSLTPNADFAMVAASMANKVHQAFPGVANAGQTMTGIFSDKGVIGCSKILALGPSDKRSYYGIPTATAAVQNELIPGPLQFKVSAPAGVLRVRVTGKVAAGGMGGFMGGGNPPVTVLVRAGSPITFTRQGANLINDSEKQLEVTVPKAGTLTASVDDLICGTSKDIYVTLATKGGGGTIQDLAIVVDAPSSADCAATVDAGVPDAGQNTETRTVPSVGIGSGVEGPMAKVGCGCTAGFDLAPLAALLALAGLRRRR